MKTSWEKERMGRNLLPPHFVRREPSPRGVQAGVKALIHNISLANFQSSPQDFSFWPKKRGFFLSRILYLFLFPYSFPLQFCLNSSFLSLSNNKASAIPSLRSRAGARRSVISQSVKTRNCWEFKIEMRPTNCCAWGGLRVRRRFVFSVQPHEVFFCWKILFDFPRNCLFSSSLCFDRESWFIGREKGGAGEGGKDGCGYIHCQEHAKVGTKNELLNIELLKASP